MRSGDLLRWTWQMIDTVDFAACIIPRAKKGIPQRLEIPEVLRPILRHWWAAHGSPTAARPVFPITRGNRVGEARKARGVSFAEPLRRELLRAGVVRHECSGSCFCAEEPEPCPNFASDPLYDETETTLPVDFHSFRRAFNTALAEAGVNVQQAMHLAGHSDPKVHAMYIMGTKRMQQIPAAALPMLPTISGTAVPERAEPSNDTTKATACNYSGGGEIRTPGRLPYGGFQTRCA
jgi:integrase